LFKVSIFAAGEFWPVECQAAADKLRCNISPVREKAFRNEAIVGEFGLYASRYDLTLAELDKCPFGLLTPRVIEFGRIYSRKSDSHIVDDDGVPIDHPASAPKYGTSGRTWCLWDDDDKRRTARRLRRRATSPRK